VATRLVSSIHENAIFVLTLEADDDYPRLERTVLDSLEREAQRLAREPQLRACVITGTSKAFAAGAEISELAALDRSAGFEFARRGQCAMNVVAHSRKPFVAAISGFCFGGGLDLALRVTRESVATMQSSRTLAARSASSRAGVARSACRA
jgi:enoyl-CoA hydratase/carnithine racemase